MLKLDNLEFLEVANEAEIVEGGGILCCLLGCKCCCSSVSLDKDIDIDIDADVNKSFDIDTSGVEGNSAEASASADAFGDNTFTDAVAFAQSSEDPSQSFAEAIAVNG